MDAKEKVALAKELMKDGNVAYERRWEIFEYLFDGLKAGISEAAGLLACAYNNGHMAEEDLATFCAYNALEKNMHDPEGLYYWANDSHFHDRIYALSLFKESADLGYALSAFEYARMMESVNPYQSEKYYELAIKGEVYKAAYKYALFKKSRALCEEDEKEVFELMKLAAEHQINEAYLYLGKMYDFGYGTEVNHEEARRWYKEAMHFMESDHAFGLMGRQYIYGLGVEVDYLQGAAMLEKASTHWNPMPELLYELARCYELGLGIEKDEEKAKELLEQAGKQMIFKK